MSYLRTLFIAVGVTLPTLAFAQQSAVRGACMSDIKTLCGSVQPGGGRIRDCIREHREQLSSGCKMALVERIQQRREGRGERGQGRPGGPANPGGSTQQN
jgi:hypothetical protein